MDDHQERRQTNIGLQQKTKTQDHMKTPLIQNSLEGGYKEQSIFIMKKKIMFHLWWRHKKRSNKKWLDIAMSSMSISSHVMSHHVPLHFVDYVNSIMEKYNVKWKSKIHSCNVKSHVRSQKVIKKSNNHERGPRVTTEVKNHPIFDIYTLILQENDFSPWVLP